MDNSIPSITFLLSYFVKVNVLVVPNVAGWLELYIGLVEFGSVIVTVTVSDWPSFPFNVTVHLESFLSTFVLVSPFTLILTVLLFV